MNVKQDINSSNKLIEIKETPVVINKYVQKNVGSSHDVDLDCVPYAPCPVDSSCRCDRGLHTIPKVKDLGQCALAKVSKKQLCQIDIQILDNKCQAFSQFMAQQPQHTGFVPLSPFSSRK